MQNSFSIVFFYASSYNLFHIRKEAVMQHSAYKSIMNTSFTPPPPRIWCGLLPFSDKYCCSLLFYSAALHFPANKPTLYGSMPPLRPQERQHSVFLPPARTPLGRRERQEAFRTDIECGRTVRRRGIRSANERELKKKHSRN
jgi:hypothetical protein